jgi:type II secretory ATPase GspE/PulE/Tfp pilus assembly ATPase PilB-like protein
MAEPVKPPDDEAAAHAKDNGKAAQQRQRALQKAGNRKPISTDALTKQWMDLVKEKEGASRLRQDHVSGLDAPVDVLDAIAAEAGMEKIRLSQVDFTAELLEQISPEIASRYGVVPVRYTADEIWVAVSDPHNVQALDELSILLRNKRVHGMVAMSDEIDRALRKHYTGDEYKNIYEEMSVSDDPGSLDKKYEELDLTEKPADEQRASVKFVDKLFQKAVHERASDIHLEPTKAGLTIRFRIDGVLQEVTSPLKKWMNMIISRIKVMAGMDLAEKRIPLDGRIRLNLPDKKLDLRVSTLPTIFGESIVMRLLDPSSVMMGLEDVGFLPESIATFKEMIKSPNGVILMTGPTGSGKTTTLYAALGVLNTPENKLMTLEDPVEYQIPGIVQIQINNEIELGFPRGLRAILRQSPDIILVGEIRDAETAENAIRAALTGHLVFSTLHTNDAPSSTVRLIDMGIKPYLVASSLQAAIAQRLVRRLCPGCKAAHRPKPEVIAEAGYNPDDFIDTDFFVGEGCERCGKTGYRGRTAIHEIMVMDADLRRRVIRSESASRLKKAAMGKGMETLRDDGWKKAVLGQTSIEEVLRVTGADEA